MKIKMKITLLITMLLAFMFLPDSLILAKRKPIVVPTHDSYVLVHGAYLWPVHGYYSLHPIILPEIISQIVYLPAWNGVFWAYEYKVVPQIQNSF